MTPNLSFEEDNIFNGEDGTFFIGNHLGSIISDKFIQDIALPMKKTPLKLDWRKLVGFDTIESFVGHLDEYYAARVTEPLDEFATLDYKLIEETLKR